MEDPAAFESALSLVHQDILRTCSNLEEIAAFAVSGVRKDDARSVLEFLDEMTSGAHSAEELDAFWRASPADVFIGNGEGVATMFRLMRAKLDLRYPDAASQRRSG